MLFVEFDSSYSFTVLQLAVRWPEGLRYLLSTDAKRFLDKSPCPGVYYPTVAIACYTGNQESVKILLEAGCELDLSRRIGPIFADTSTECMAAVASNLGTRRVHLLKLAQERLGIFLEGTTVTFADLKAASICESLDKASIPIHRSLRVERDYKSIYSCPGIPIAHFRLFWEKGFYDGLRRHDNLGLVPTMTYRVSMFWPIQRMEISNIYDSYSWIRDNGFLNITPTDPLKLGFNISATAHHYIGAMFGAFYDFRMPDLPLSPIFRLVDELSSVQVEDECVCWCNRTSHGCSPLKLLLKSHLDELWPGITFDIQRHFFLHHTVLYSSSLLRGFAMEVLRLLTFEALDMTHTCCTFESLGEDIVKDLVSTASERPAAIFSCQAKTVREIRSSAREISNARLLEDLMLEFTSHLSQQGPGSEVFELFIKTYWRRRMSEIYVPDPHKVGEMEQHQAFRGFKASSGVETCKYLVRNP
ncbi:unnamed protein product [Fusarium graminearum]|nr:unnamed protein product [Fusarium graminearum]